MISSRQFELHDDAAEVRFTGLLPLKTLRRRLLLPYEEIRSVSTEQFTRRRGLLRVAGFALGNSLHGLFRREGRWLFLSFEDPRQVVNIELDPERRKVSELVIQVPDPVALAAALDRRSRTGKRSSTPN
jgi:hypothetical protein